MYTINGRQRETRLYDRTKAVQYAHKWAYARNPSYYDFENTGGDCTNFASQCLYAGSSVMNYAPVCGWYYTSSYNRTPSWTSVNYLYEFLINNKGAGPIAEQVDISEAEPGDLVQISFSSSQVFDHTPIIIKKESKSGMSGIFVAAHTFDTDFYRLTDFEPLYVRYLHILDVRI